jgi:lipoprotein-anchoring transpeptidase ErfK/SrfK
VAATAALYLFGGGSTGTAEEKASAPPKVQTARFAGPARFAVEPAPADEEQLRNKFHEEQIALLEKLNRADQLHLVRLPEIVVPGRWDLDELDYSPLPAVWQDAGKSPKTLVLSQPFQVFGAYENGKLVRWGPVSSGRKSRPTPPGLFYLNWKSRGRKSTVDGGWFLRWYFNFINERGISFHEFDLPGRPESHGCVRLLSRDAEWLFHWGEQWKLDAKGWKPEKQGTPVLILGTYDYGKPAPWFSTEYLAADRPVRLDGGAVPEALLVKLRQGLIPVPVPPVTEDGLAGPPSGSRPSIGEKAATGLKSVVRGAE